MQRYDKRNFPLKDYEKFIAIQKKNNNDFKEQIIGSRKKLFIYNRLIATTSSTTDLPLGDLKKQSFNAFLGMFNRTLYKSFLTNESLFDLKIKYRGLARSRNLKAWDSLPDGSFFYNVDLKSAYWQITYKLGYISESIYLKYMGLDTYKQAKRYCISFLARTNKMLYFEKDNHYIISCDISILKQVYDNVRNKLYETINSSIQGIDNWIEYNIDGVTIYSEDLDLVKQRFEEYGLEYKINVCQKINEYQYSQKGIVRNFKNV